MSKEASWVLLVKKSERRGGGFTQKGPFSTQEIKIMLKKGESRYQDHVWQEGFESWVKIALVDDFNEPVRSLKSQFETDKGLPELEEEIIQNVLSIPGKELLKSVHKTKPKTYLKAEPIPSEAEGEDLTKTRPIAPPKPVEAEPPSSEALIKTPKVDISMQLPKPPVVEEKSVVVESKAVVETSKPPTIEKAKIANTESKVQKAINVEKPKLKSAPKNTSAPIAKPAAQTAPKPKQPAHPASKLKQPMSPASKPRTTTKPVTKSAAVTQTSGHRQANTNTNLHTQTELNVATYSRQAEYGTRVQSQQKSLLKKVIFKYLLVFVTIFIISALMFSLIILKKETQSPKTVKKTTYKKRKSKPKSTYNKLKNKIMPSFKRTAITSTKLWHKNYKGKLAFSSNGNKEKKLYLYINAKAGDILNNKSYYRLVILSRKTDFVMDYKKYNLADGAYTFKGSLGEVENTGTFFVGSKSKSFYVNLKTFKKQNANWAQSEKKQMFKLVKKLESLSTNLTSSYRSNFKNQTRWRRFYLPWKKSLNATYTVELKQFSPRKSPKLYYPEYWTKLSQTRTELRKQLKDYQKSITSKKYIQNSPSIKGKILKLKTEITDIRYF